MGMVAAGVGYTGLDTLSLFKAWAKANDHVPEHYASAYPTVTAHHDIRRAWHRRQPATETIAHHPRLVRVAPPEGGRPTVMPLQPGASAAAAAAAHALECEPRGRAQLTSSLLVDDAEPPEGPRPRPLGVHFVRLTILEYPSGSWLLFTMVYDGKPPIRTVLERMLQSDLAPTAADGASRPGPLHRLLACADGCPGPTVLLLRRRPAVSFVLQPSTLLGVGPPSRMLRLPEADRKQADLADLAVDPTPAPGLCRPWRCVGCGTVIDLSEVQSIIVRPRGAPGQVELIFLRGLLSREGSKLKLYPAGHRGRLDPHHVGPGRR